jgi:hypothetical protein
MAFLMMAAASSLSAQQRGGGGAGPPASPQASAPIDLTGYWVAIVNEDWRWRMVTPPAKDYGSVPINPEGRRVADTWDISKDGSCLAYGAGGLMRMPTRLHITWENDSTLKIDTDAGQQTRRLLFTKPAAASVERSLQGLSVAEWERPGGGRGAGGGGGRGAGPGAAPPAAGPGPAAAAPGAAGGRGGAGGPPGAPAARAGSLKVVTTNLSGGWLRKNGVPYSEQATVTEFYDRFAVGADQWLVVTTIVADPKYLTQEFVTSSHFKREPDAAKWDPAPCKS